MQLARLAVGANAVPVEQSIRRIAGLLNLGDQQTSAESVYRAGRDENALTRASLERVQTFFGASLANRSGKSLAIHAAPQSCVNPTARLSVENDPCFRLA